MEEGDVEYTLSGTITAVTNTTYGNFYLTDETGTVLIYGLCSPEGAQKYWAASGAKLGDDIVVKTIRSSYNNAPQGKNAKFVKLVSPGTRAFWSFDKEALVFGSAAAEHTIKVDAYNLKNDISVVSDNTQFSATYASGTLTVSALENTTTDAISGNITVTCGTLSQVITITQSGVVVGGVETAEATITFDNKAKRTTFTDTQQVWEENGITVTNDKNKSTNKVADYAKPARFYQGSKVTVTAPGEITQIIFDCNSSSYATELKNSIKSGATVTVASDKVTAILTIPASSFVVDQLVKQVRMDAITVTYNK